MISIFLYLLTTNCYPFFHNQQLNLQFVKIILHNNILTEKHTKLTPIATKNCIYFKVCLHLIFSSHFKTPNSNPISYISQTTGVVDLGVRVSLHITTRNLVIWQGQKPWQNAKSLGNWTFARSRITSKSAHRK